MKLYEKHGNWEIFYDEMEQKFSAHHPGLGPDNEPVTLEDSDVRKLRDRCDKTEKNANKKVFEKIPVLYEDKDNDAGYIPGKITSVDKLSYGDSISCWMSFEENVGYSKRGVRNTHEVILDTPQNREKCAKVRELTIQIMQIQKSYERVDDKALMKFLPGMD